MKILLKALSLLLETDRLFWVLVLLGIGVSITQFVFIPTVFCQDEYNLSKKSNADHQENDISLASFFVRFYQRYISVFDGDRCPMYPSCSQYSLQCFKKHGFLLGLIMTCDRLLHEPDEMGRVPLFFSNGRTLYFDPVDENDRWWETIEE
ncbi:MAG: membrane protein insertion efficiency factor YidD [Candidatus Magnetomorum sp.]|nr:membrane protein insertion efficiency factor YidD [Candidatus Magnetomorum sp.]